MARLGTSCLLLALVIFLIFFSNVALGAAGIGGFLGDVPEMLTLLGAAILFVVGVLAREKNRETTTGDAKNV